MITNVITPLRVGADEELLGLDISQHGERMSSLEDNRRREEAAAIDAIHRRAHRLDHLATFLSGTYTVTADADRMGYRLDGPEIEHLDGFNTISDAILTGSIQIPGIYFSVPDVCCAAAGAAIVPIASAATETRPATDFRALENL